MTNLNILTYRLIEILDSEKLTSSKWSINDRIIFRFVNNKSTTDWQINSNALSHSEMTFPIIVENNDKDINHSTLSSFVISKNTDLSCKYSAYLFDGKSMISIAKLEKLN